MCRLRTFQILVIALSIVILLGLAIIVYRVFFWQSLRIDSPQGGVAWETGKEQTIKWTSRGGIQAVRLDYSTDGGTFQAIGQAPAEDGAYPWTPNIQSSNVRVRVSGVDNADLKDVSEPFTIATDQKGVVADIAVSSPEAGAQWAVGSQRAIKWTAPGRTEDLALSYTIGGAYIAIQTVPSQLGTFAWTVPTTPSNSAQVRLSSTITPSISGTSSLFSIVPMQASLALTAPQGGETWQVGSTQTIQWTSGNASGDVRLMWSFDGAPARTIVDSVPISDQSYSWMVEPICKPVTENAWVTVESLAQPGLSDTNPQPFTISTPALRADPTVCLPQGRCYVTNDPAISGAGSGYSDGTIAAPWILTGPEGVAGPDQDRALQEYRWALYETLVCDQLGNGPYELIAVLCTGYECTTNRCEFVYDSQGRVTITCFDPEPGLPAGWGVDLPFPYILTGGLLLGALLIGAGLYLRRRARPVAPLG